MGLKVIKDFLRMGLFSVVLFGFNGFKGNKDF
jgi:hypothetical protein